MAVTIDGRTWPAEDEAQVNTQTSGTDHNYIRCNKCSKAEDSKPYIQCSKCCKPQTVKYSTPVQQMWQDMVDSIHSCTWPLVKMKQG